MAKGLKTGGRPFAPGNPYGGRPRLPEDIRRVQAELSVDVLKIKIKNFLLKSEAELAEIARHPDTQMIDKILCNIIERASTLADQQRLDFVLTRLLGKEPEKVIQLNLHQHYNSDLEEIPIEVLRALAAKKDIRDNPEFESDIDDDGERDE